jgi:uncharacterized membrane protein YqiK
LIKQRSRCEHDCLDDVFITYESNQESKVSKITLHYFEKFFDFKKKLRRATYNVFDLTDDFIKLIEECGEVLPSDKTHIVKRIKKLVGNDINPRELVEGLDSATKREIEEMENGFREMEKKLSVDVTKASENVEQAKQTTEQDKKEFRATIESRMSELDKLVEVMLY